MEMSGPDALAQAVTRVMQRVRYVKQTGWNNFHRYHYASHEDILRAVQQEMAAEGLALIPSDMSVSTTQHTDNAKGKAQWRTDVVVTYTLRHSSGASARVVSAGCGIDGEDKGIYKALTGAHKYALTELFLIPTGEQDDPEFTGGQPEPERQPEPAPKATTEQAAALRKAFFAKFNDAYPMPAKGEWDDEVFARAKAAWEENRKAVAQAFLRVDSLSDDTLTALDAERVTALTSRLRAIPAADFKVKADGVLGAE